MGQKHKKEKKEKKEKYIPEYRTKDERVLETKPILEKLTELGLTLDNNPEIKELFLLIQRYIKDGERIEVNIPFPSINKTIKGVLAINIREEVYVKMISEKY
jgi:hypothetical protein